MQTVCNRVRRIKSPTHPKPATLLYTLIYSLYTNITGKKNKNITKIGGEINERCRAVLQFVSHTVQVLCKSHRGAFSFQLKSHTHTHIQIHRRTNTNKHLHTYTHTTVRLNKKVTLSSV